MDPFLNYPPEMIKRICNELDTSSLINAAKSSSRIYQVCSDIITERKEEFEKYQAKIQTFKEYIQSNMVTWFVSYFDDLLIEIKIFNSTNDVGRRFGGQKDSLDILQFIEPINSPKDFGERFKFFMKWEQPSDLFERLPWIFPGEKWNIFKGNRHIVKLNTEDNLYQLAKNLVDQGYEIKIQKNKFL